jgi:hypothetical protein
MKSKSLLWATRIIGLLVVAGVTGVLAGTRAPNHFAGLINDYTATAGGTGPWEVRGPWTLNVNEKTGKADFSAAVTMELSDFALSGTNIGTSARTQHTHHLTVEGGTVKSITGGFEVTGPVTITKDGGAAPAAIQGSSLVIDITGGTLVEFSNVALTFEDGAVMHFGSAPLHGVIRKAIFERDADRQ